MTNELIGALGIIVLLLLMASGLWIGLALAITGFLGVLLIQGMDSALMIAGTASYSFINNYSFSVMPMFILMGAVIGETGIGSDLYGAAHKWIGQFRGGLAMATVAASAMFAAIVGSSSAGVIVFSRVAYPEMKKFNYADDLSSATIVASATMGTLIPPSITFIIYGVLTENSVGKLFMAGIIPGIMQAIAYIILIYIICRVKPSKGPAGPKATWGERIKSLKGVWMMGVLFILVMGSIYSGVCTPTEAGALGAFGAIVITVASKRMSGKGMQRALLDSGIMLGMMMLTMLAVALFTKFMSVSQLPFWLANLVTQVSVPPFVILLLILALFLIAGTAMPAMLIIILTVPILYPVILALGFDPIWFGVLMVIMAEMGDISPPEGMVVFMMSGLSGVSVITIFKGLIPFLGADLFRVAAIIAWPSLSLFIPNMMSK